jgi:hypothetical protein
MRTHARRRAGQMQLWEGTARPRPLIKRSAAGGQIGMMR